MKLISRKSLSFHKTGTCMHYVHTFMDQDIYDPKFRYECKRSLSCLFRSAAGSHMSSRSRSRVGCDTSQHYHRPGSALLDPNSQRSYMSSFVPPPPASNFRKRNCFAVPNMTVDLTDVIE